MKIALIGGNWDHEKGKPSGYIKKLYEELQKMEGIRVVDFNGGSFEFLKYLLNTSRADNCLAHMDAILWFANVPNTEEKIVRSIKELFPKCLLVTSKANYDGKYSHMDLVARALQNKSNLLLEFTKEEDIIFGKLIDPLGNLFYSGKDIDLIALATVERLKELKAFTRIGCHQLYDKPIIASANSDFLETITECGEKFHTLIHGANTSRFLGNASFRCESGFPSYKDGDYIFVSKRNIDKRDIGSEGFVAVDAASLERDTKVLYYGEHKPSVDTPVQLCLYSYYKDINYMLHSHCYVKNAPFTAHKISCGALEEVGEIIKVMPWRNISNFAINLLGHGSIILASTSYGITCYTKDYVARPTPER